MVIFKTKLHQGEIEKVKKYFGSINFCFE